MYLKHTYKASIFLFTFLIPLLATAQHGRQINTGLDVLRGEKNTSARFQMVYNYQFTSEFSAGLGMGFTYYDDPQSLLPLFINMKYKPGQTPIAPFIFLSTGYSFSILTDTNVTVDSHQGGFMLNPGIGLQFRTENGPDWHLSIGYNIDKSQFEVQQDESQTVETELTYKRLMTGFGLSF